MHISERHGMMPRGEMMNILFVCTGNTCRSPMAEYIFRQKTQYFKGYFNVYSFGMAAVDGTPASENAVNAMEKRGIDITAHKAQRISAQIVKDSDYIFCLSHEQYNIMFGVEPEKTFLLGNGIPDPYGMDQTVYDRCADKISQAIDELLASDLFFSTQLMEYEDIPVVAEIEKSCFSEPWSENSFFSHLSKPYSRSFTVKYLNKPVGYICCDYIVDEMSIGTIAVDVNMRRRHIADKLLTMIIDICEYLGALILTLEVRVSNVAAQNLYKKYGFKNLGIRKGFYSKPKEDAYIMTKYFVGEECLNENNFY